MSRIMRELAEEGRRARAASGAPTAPPPPAADVDEPWPFLAPSEPELCSHGIEFDRACYACGRFAP